MTTIYHNPRCSKSRATLALLRDRGIEPQVIEYLKTPPDRATLEELLRKLGCDPGDLVRKGEAAYRDRGLRDADPDAVLEAMVEEPGLIERPVVVHGGRARVGRPPEAVLDLF